MKKHEKKISKRKEGDVLRKELDATVTKDEGEQIIEDVRKESAIKTEQEDVKVIKKDIEKDRYIALIHLMNLEKSLGKNSIKEIEKNWAVLEKNYRDILLETDEKAYRVIEYVIITAVDDEYLPYGLEKEVMQKIELMEKKIMKVIGLL